MVKNNRWIVGQKNMNLVVSMIAMVILNRLLLIASRYGHHENGYRNKDDLPGKMSLVLHKINLVSNELIVI